MMKSDAGDAPRESGASNQSHDSSRDITSCAASEQPAVTATDLRVTRGRKEILHGLDLNLAPGTITGLLGPSGTPPAPPPCAVGSATSPRDRPSTET